jgi:predicted O-methyltransferase YrrM
MLVTNFRFKYLVYRIVCAIYQVLDVGRIHPVRERALRALQDTVDYIDEKLPGAVGFETQKELIEYTLAQVKVDGHYLEFGVFTGGTTRFMAKRVPGKTLHGFDSFEGLPEAWGGFSLGAAAFDVKGKLPKVPANVQLHPGWFDKTLAPWVAENPGMVAFMHIDCDLYSSTKTIFELLADRLQPGTIILFDEYFNYPNWREHEFKAFQEFVAAKGIDYDYLGYARQQVTVRIKAVRGIAA